jgi:iron complex transport system substrate-binding protein
MHGRTRLASAVIATAVSLALVGCVKGGTGTSSSGGGASGGGVASEFKPVTVTDDASRAVTIEKRPMRIVSLAPGNTEIVAALGLTSRLVGVTTYDDYPPEVTKLPKVGDFVTPNLEAIAAAKPDVILVTTGVQADVLAKLDKLGAKVIAVDPASIDKLYVAIGDLGRVLGEPEKAARIVADMKARIAEVRSRIAGRKPVTAFIEIAQNPLYTTGPGTLLADVLTQAGGKNVVTEKAYVGYSLEQVLKDDPAVYLATKGSMNDPLDVATRTGYDRLSAVKNGRVFALTDNLVSRPGPRIPQGVREVASRLYPDAFE